MEEIDRERRRAHTHAHTHARTLARSHARTHASARPCTHTCTQGPKVSASNAVQFDFFSQIRCSRFVLCPSGQGWDTYRIWEALILGAIPIVEFSPGWIRVLDDLPALIVKDFTELTPMLLLKEYERIARKPRRYNFKRLTTQWWIDRIAAMLPNLDHRPTIVPTDVPAEATCVIGDLASTYAHGHMHSCVHVPVYRIHTKLKPSDGWTTRLLAP